MEGISAAKARGVYKGRKSSIDAAKVRRLHTEEKLGPAAIASRLGIRRGQRLPPTGQGIPGRSGPSGVISAGICLTAAAILIFTRRSLCFTIDPEGRHQRRHYHILAGARRPQGWFRKPTAGRYGWPDEER